MPYYKLIQQRRAAGPMQGRSVWTARAAGRSLCRAAAFYQDLSRSSTLSPEEAQMTLGLALDTLVMLLKRGMRVELGELGTLRLELTSHDVLDPRDFDPRVHMKPPRVSFIPSKRLLRAVQHDIHYQLHP